MTGEPGQVGDPSAGASTPTPAVDATSRSEAPRVKRKRQLGCERRTGALPVVDGHPGRWRLIWARLLLLVTGLGFAVYLVDWIRTYGDQHGRAAIVEAWVYLLLIATLTASAFGYLIARLGYIARIRAHRRVPRKLIDDAFEREQPTLTVIVPSLREEPRVVRQTLLSAALQEYPGIRVALLIDDPPNPGSDQHRRLLEAARALPGEITELLAEPRDRFEAALDAFESTLGSRDSVTSNDLLRLAAEYEAAVTWLRAAAADVDIVDHTDAFLAGEIFGRLADDLVVNAIALREAAGEGAALSVTRVRQLYRRLAWIFRAEVTSFERKAFASLSHAPNKASNLNSYIGLMGGSYRVCDTVAGRILLPVSGDDADLVVPDPDYVLTLDADSVLLPEYCLRLVAYMQRPEHARVAVVQTPYSAFRGAATRLERIAGGTTDVQHLVHQGMTRFGATSWVGASAVLRKTALDDIAVEESHGGLSVRRYIQNRTLTEDSESTLDLRLRGWQLHNYPERLSYSATPPDFGALSIQRERWANGGLLIMPKVLRMMWVRKRIGATMLEGFLRLAYLLGVLWAGLGLAVLLFYPFDDSLVSGWALMAAAPFFFALASDLRRSGYKRRDVFGVYGLNLLLLPINTVGALKSMAQAIGGSVVVFARTPKVRTRTVAPFYYVVVPYVIIGWALLTLASDVDRGNWWHAAFAALNAVSALYAMVVYYGLWHSISDFCVDLWARMHTSRRLKESAAATPDWATVLFHGSRDLGRLEEGSGIAAALAALDREPGGRPEIVFKDARPVLANGNGALSTNGASGRGRVSNGNGAPSRGGREGELERALAEAIANEIAQLPPGGRLEVVRNGDDYRIQVGVESDAAVPA
ncbi:MAG: glycosyltransferase [Thermoleophilia bacterium]|nr:glycosyltransferase [Thermoleophilia bacterium]